MDYLPKNSNSRYMIKKQNKTNNSFSKLNTTVREKCCVISSRILILEKESGGKAM